MDFYDLVKSELSEIESEMERLIPKHPAEVYSLLIPFLKRGGKRIRPALSLLCCGATGGNLKKVYLPASIIELFHNFTLIHDDIEDNSLVRRGEPTLHVSHGIPLALNSGDALYTVIWDTMSNLKMPADDLITLQKMFASSFRKVVEGQGTELSWYLENKFNITENDYFSMVGGKTAALLGLSCEIGGYISGAEKTQCTSLKTFGEKIGLAFQIQDDVLNVTGDFSRYKKEIGGDISEGKRTLMVVKVLENAAKSEKQVVENILNSHTRNQKQINQVISLFDKYGAIDYAVNSAKDLLHQAKQEISWLPDGKYKTGLLNLADFVVNRSQ